MLFNIISLLNTSSQTNGEITNHEFVFQKLKSGGCQSFGKDVSDLIKRRDILNLDIFVMYFLKNKMEIYLNVFGASVVNWIGCKGNCTLIIALDCGRRMKR